MQLSNVFSDICLEQPDFAA